MKQLRAELHAQADPVKARLSARFFKTGPGDYAEHDRFLGITVPALRSLARLHRTLPPEHALAFVQSPWHEERMLGLLLWMEAWKLAGRSSPEASEDTKRRINDLLLEHRAHVNNWDLVDIAVPTLLGEWLLAHPDPALLDRLCASPVLWERRMAVIATFAAIRAGSFTDILRLCEALLCDPHDLMHKACGWMLRETGKRDTQVLRQFLSNHAPRMPRTMLRYCVERMDATERRRWMGA